MPRLSWRSFVPPLPAHEGWGPGWCLISDVLVRLPLSIFVKLVSLTYEVTYNSVHTIENFFVSADTDIWSSQ